MSSTNPVRVALLQINPTVGDLAGNARRLVEAARRAQAQGACLAVAPELAPKARELVVSTSGPGEVFAWSALVPPCVAISSGKAQTPCRAVAFDCGELRARFEDDPRFGFLMTQKAAQVIRDRLRDMHLESLGQADARGLAIGERR